MYGFQSDFPVSEFLSLDLELICVNENMFYFHFGKEVIVSADNFEFKAADGDNYQKYSKYNFHHLVFKALGSSVTVCNVIGDDSLNVGFENGAHIRFTDDSSIYESVSIEIRGRTITV